MVLREFLLFFVFLFLFSLFSLLSIYYRWKRRRLKCVCVRERMRKEETYGIFDSDGLSVSLPGCLTGRPGWFGLDWTGLDLTKLGWAGLGWAELGWGWEWNGLEL